MYTVLEAFDDLHDFKETKEGKVYTSYEVGDEYPRKGYKPSAARIEELAGSGNVRGYALIADQDTQPTETEAEAEEAPAEEVDA